MFYICNQTKLIMKNIVSDKAVVLEQDEEIKKIFENNDKILKSLIVFSIIEMVLLMAML